MHRMRFWRRYREEPTLYFERDITRKPMVIPLAIALERHPDLALTSSRFRNSSKPIHKQSTAKVKRHISPEQSKIPPTIVVVAAYSCEILICVANVAELSLFRAEVKKKLSTDGVDIVVHVLLAGLRSIGFEI